MITISVEDPDQPEVIRMLADGEAESARLYPAESTHHLPLAALRAPGVLFHVARDGEGRALGTGAVVVKGDWAEIKRMWTDPAARGRGVAMFVLTALEVGARGYGVRTLRLETGIHSRGVRRMCWRG